MRPPARPSSSPPSSGPSPALPPGARADLGWCLRLIDGGDRRGALEACERALSQAPLHPEVLLIAALLYLDLGRTGEAEEHYRRLIEVAPRTPKGWHGLGRCLLARGDPAPALECLDRAVDLGEAGPEVAHDRAVGLTQLGRQGEALTAIDGALAAAPTHPRFLSRRARILERLNRPEEALAAARAALAGDPEDALAARVEIEALLLLERKEEALNRAETELARLLALPSVSEAVLVPHLDLSYRVARQADQPNLGDRFARMVLARFPDSLGAAHLLAQSLWWMEDFDGAMAVLDRCLTQAPDDLDSLWLRMLLTARPLHATEEARSRARTDFIAAAMALGDRLLDPQAPPPPEALGAFDPLAHGYPFYAPYHGPLDLEAQRRIGGCLSLVQEHWAARHPTPISSVSPRSEDGRFRVVFVSAFFRHHTVCKLFRSWVADLDRARFHVTVLHLGDRMDRETKAVAGLADAFHHVPRGGLPALALLRNLEPDAILYPELGMNNDSLRLAAIRLAPVQAMAWGHPATTGLPSIDLFLSSDLMEPPTGHLAYTERLTRLPGLSIRYAPAFGVEDAATARTEAREHWRMDPDTPILLSLQTHAKYAPADDWILARICARLPEARLVLIEALPPIPKGHLRARLAEAFRAEGADPDRQIQMVPHMNQEAYRRLNLAGDVFLDNPAWSGGNTTLEAVHCGLPVVTLPGQAMWSRHSAAILTALKTPETIAKDRDSYVDLALRLVRDRPWRDDLIARMAKALPGVLSDPEPGRALSDTLDRAIRRARAGKRP